MKFRSLRLRYGTHFMADEGGDEGNGGGGDGEPLLKDWRTHLPETLVNDKSLESFDDIGKLAQAFVDTKADVGRSIRIPGPDAGADVVDSFNTKLMESVPGLAKMPDMDNKEEVLQLYDKLGRPKDASDYPTPEGLPDNEMGASLKEQLNDLKKVSHEEGLTKGQFEAQAKAIVENYNTQMTAIQGNIVDEQDKLKVDWGSAVQAKTQDILNLAKQTDAPQSIIDGIAEKALDATTMKWLDGLVNALSGEGPQMKFQGQGSETRITPIEANARIAEIMDKPEYWDQGNPQQEVLMKKVVELGKIAESGG